MACTTIRNTKKQRNCFVHHLAHSDFLLAKTQVDHRHEEVHGHQLSERLKAGAHFEAHALDLLLAFLVSARENDQENWSHEGATLKHESDMNER